MLENKDDPTRRYNLINGTGLDGYMQYVAIDKNTNESFQAREVHRKSVLSCHFFTKLRTEFEILGSISHPLIQRFVESSFEPQCYYQIVGSEKTNILQFYEKDFPLTESVARQVFFYLVRAVSYLHESDIVHLNIRPDKVFVDKGQFRLGGFFYAKFASDDEIVTGSYGTPNFQAPEIFLNPNFDGRKADVWACGIFLLSILTGKLPFEYAGCVDSDGKEVVLSEKKSQEAFEDVKRQVTQTELEIPKYLSDEAQDLLRLLLARDPSKRPPMNMVKDHKWLAGVVDENGVLPAPTQAKQMSKAQVVLIKTQKSNEEVLHIIKNYFDGENVQEHSSNSLSVHRMQPDTGMKFVFDEKEQDGPVVKITRRRVTDEDHYKHILDDLTGLLNK